MDKLDSYLKDTLGLQISSEKWELPSSLPMFLRNAADYSLCLSNGIEFLVAQPIGESTLPELKRIPHQLARYTDLRIVLVSDEIDSRQRKALVSQGISFVVPGKQVYLPFLALVVTAETNRRSYDGPISARAQAAFVTLIANPGIDTAATLLEITKMSASNITRAVDELAQRELIERGKHGRKVTIAFDNSGNALLRRAMPLLSSPVVRSFYAASDFVTAKLPDAGESALAKRSLLVSPRIVQKAVFKNELTEFSFAEVLEGELHDSKTVQIQVWSYAPLVARFATIDDVSLALSLVPEDDERIFGQLNELFNEEDLWH
jgi:DNA-binding MarR family transcriptional regulator